MITKDADFRNGYFLNKNPQKLTKINLGNISNMDLISKIEENLVVIEKISELENFIIEIDKNELHCSTQKT